MTDIGVGAGLIDLGDRKRVAGLRAGEIKAVLERAKEMIEENVDRVKADAGDVTLMAVGGGAFLVPERLQGVASVKQVDHGGGAHPRRAATSSARGGDDQVFHGSSLLRAVP